MCEAINFGTKRKTTKLCNRKKKVRLLRNSSNMDDNFLFQILVSRFR